LSKGADSSGLKQRYPVENQNVPTQEKNQLVEENSRLTNEFKVKNGTLIQENKKQFDKKQQELDQYQNEWIEKVEALRKENLALEKQNLALEKQNLELEKQRNNAIKERDEAIAAVDVIQKNETKKMKEPSLQDRVKEIEQLKLQQQTKVVDSSSREFRNLLVDIDLELTAEEWKKMSHRFQIPKNKLPDSAFNFFWWLMETNEISSVNLSLLETLLIQHHRPQLVEQFITPYRLRNANK